MHLKPGASLTYSPAFTLVPTNECFNRCTYCNFRRDPNEATWLSLDDARRQLRQLQGSGVSEILILSGEVHPQSSRRSDWFDHIYQLCELVLTEGFLPHSNVGPLTYREMSLLGRVNVSMGLMLEQNNQTLDAHVQAPSKDPQLRLQQLHWAGELRIPFTTGLLLGIGETQRDWEKSLNAIGQVHRQWGHIQEIILQPYQPGSHEPHPQKGCSGAELLEALKLARSILPETIAIQIPPNLISQPLILRDCLRLGATDLGGLVPHDVVNPDYAHPPFPALKTQLQNWGYDLQPRLPVYDRFCSMLPNPLQRSLKPWLSGKNKLGYSNGKVEVDGLTQSSGNDIFTAPSVKSTVPPSC